MRGVLRVRARLGRDSWPLPTTANHCQPLPTTACHCLPLLVAPLNEGERPDGNEP